MILGIYVTITIGTGEIITTAIIVPFVATKSRFHHLIFAGGFIEFIAIIIWNVIHISRIPPLPFSLIVILFVYVGHEWLFCGIMFKNQQIAHRSQQVILSSFWTVIITVSGSIGNIMVGELYEIEHGVEIVLMVIGILSSAVMITACVLWYFIWKKQSKIVMNVQLDKVTASE